ncbi:MAG TPA: FAD-dependent oxidoreductase [Verrucomicrobiae bacterium]|nr:FAD-dependent oxidoreductase [Verrucomicrobiae bacterium]
MKTWCHGAFPCGSCRALFVGLLCSGWGFSAAHSADVVIYGATPAGITAAVAARREGASVALVEPSRRIGGMVAGGLSSTDTGNVKTIGGLAMEFFDRCEKRYGAKEKFDCEPKGYMAVFREMLAEAGVEPEIGARLKGARMGGGRISAIELLGGRVLEGRVFIDASYEGDLMAGSGVRYIVGREPREKYGETFAGFHPNEPRGFGADVMTSECPCVGGEGPHYVHGAPCAIDGRGEDGGPLWGIQQAAAAPGDADGLTQSYNFRLCVTRREDIRVPFPKPANYEPARYELLLRLIRAYPGIRFGRLVHLAKLANGKFDLNAQGLYSTDYVGGNAGYPDGSPEQRARIWQDHVDYDQGFLWFLGHDERVPAELREETLSWGLCRDEFEDNGHWSYQLYVREARRMIGAFVMTQKDVQDDVEKADGVGMGSFIIDSHIVQRLLAADGTVIDEGAFDGSVMPYEIPYRCLTPKEAECGNLLVPVCFSASHAAYCSMRMEPVYMALGHASGVAAAMAARTDASVHGVDVSALRAKLLAQRAVLTFFQPGTVRAKNLAGLVADDRKAVFIGTWTTSTFGGGGVEGAFRHDGNAGKGTKSARYEIAVPADGKYEVRLSHIPSSNRATNVPISIGHADGTAEARVNQREAAPIDGLFVSVGAFRFSVGKPAVVTIGNAGTDGYVAADAVQLVPVR